jgi:mRNA-degrading endonuclease RelE of RelBE toxin-antitoxin system
MKDVKSEIIKMLDEVPEDVLEDLKKYLEELQDKSVNEIRHSHNLQRILREDRELLKKLAK